MYQVVRISVAALCSLFFPFFVSAATLYLDPASGTYGPGDTFVLTVRLTTDSSQCVNAAEVELTYPREVLRAVDFGRGSSIFSLWISDPKIDDMNGTISFAGGIPGGYCGRIPGDPALSNIIGKVVFTVTSSSSKSALVQFAPTTTLYQNDGLGTVITPHLSSATITIAPTALSSNNPWVAEVSADTIPPVPFDIQVESTSGVFGGHYYIVFSTLDKQSGLDHFDILENGGWKRITSPYELKDQSLRGGITVRAVDKAGNQRLGTYTEGSAPPRHYSLSDILISFGSLVLLFVLIGTYVYLHHRRSRGAVVDLRA
jgi:hypothetical protein